MKDRQPPSGNDLGDVPPEEFRKQLHQVADWIADYREKIGESAGRAGRQAWRNPGALPAQPPEEGESFEKFSRTSIE